MLVFHCVLQRQTLLVFVCFVYVLVSVYTPPPPQYSYLSVVDSQGQILGHGACVVRPSHQLSTLVLKQ